MLRINLAIWVSCKWCEL